MCDHYCVFQKSGTASMPESEGDLANCTVRVEEVFDLFAKNMDKEAQEQLRHSLAELVASSSHESE